jgi:putative colanic acid biosynthesis UDP-glucose lipid carrier transferase
MGFRLLSSHPALASDDALVAAARAGEVDVVLAAPSPAEGDRFERLLTRLADTPASVLVVPDLVTVHLRHARWVDLGDVPVVDVFDTPLAGGIEQRVKRAVDLAGALALLVLLGPVMLLIAAAIRLGSPGAVIFRQRRYGLNGREIVVRKFRTMGVTEDGPEVPQAKRGDLRVTRVGTWLRRTSLDELPQLCNVLEGTMSLVGPRPHAVAHNEQYRRLVPGYMLRHRCLPGITGLAQIRGLRGETDTVEKMERRVAADLEYAANWSLALDVKILLLTLFRVPFDRRAF